MTASLRLKKFVKCCHRMDHNVTEIGKLFCEVGCHQIANKYLYFCHEDF